MSLARTMSSFGLTFTAPRLDLNKLQQDLVARLGSELEYSGRCMPKPVATCQSNQNRELFSIHINLSRAAEKLGPFDLLRGCLLGRRFPQYFCICVTGLYCFLVLKYIVSLEVYFEYKLRLSTFIRDCYFWGSSCPFGSYYITGFNSLRSRRLILHQLVTFNLR